ncbi:MAG TPA: hypothetical protein VGC88_08615 [Terriglobales bacterium]
MKAARAGSYWIIAFIVALLIPAAALAQDSLTGQWILEAPSGNTGQLQMTLRYERHTAHSHSNSSNSFDIAADQLKGLDLAALRGSGSNTKFQLVRDAGTFNCDGWAGHGDAEGHWTFQPSAQYSSALQSKVIGSPTPEQQMRLALANTSLGFVDELKSAGYHFDVDDLIRAANHGVNSEYVHGMNALGYKPESLDALVRMRDHGVDPQYVKELAAAGLSKLPADDIVRMRDHGVDAEYIRGLAKYGITGLDGDQLAKLRDHGVDPSYIAEMQKSGLRGDPMEWTRLRDHGVSPDFVIAVEKSGLKADAEELIRLRDHGVSADFIADVQKAGLTDLSPEDVAKLRDHGVSADFIRQYGKGRSVSELIRMHDMGVRASM